MRPSRRAFLGVTAVGLAARIGVTDLLAKIPEPRRAAGPRLRLKAVAFDAFPIFNPAAVVQRAETLFPGRGSALADEWRLRQFEYAWLRSLSGHYADFWQVTEDALVFAAKKVKIDLDTAKRAALMQAFLELVPWPDVVPAIDALARSGLRLAFLSNFTPRMLDSNLQRAELSSRFSAILSTDRAKTYKPDPRAYELGLTALRLHREEIIFVAHAGWDAAGATAFGYPTFWVNRADLPSEELGVTPDATGRDLADLTRFIDRLGSDGR